MTDKIDTPPEAVFLAPNTGYVQPWAEPLIAHWGDEDGAIEYVKRDVANVERDRLAAENARLRDAVAEVDRLLEALTSVLSWHDKDKHTSGKMTFERSAAFAKARAALAAFKGDAQ